MRQVVGLALAFLACCQDAPSGLAVCTRTPRHAQLTPSSFPVHNVCIDASAIPGFAGRTPIMEVLAESGLHVEMEAELRIAPGASCDWRIVLTLAPPQALDSAALLQWSAGAGQAERFAVVSTLTPLQATSTIYSESARGAVYGVRAAAATLLPGAAGADLPTFQVGTVIDYPSFALRGVVESNYGKTYSLEERQGTLKLMSCLRENIYIYASKADRYTHYQWADPYPQDKAAVLRASARTAADQLIPFVWAVSPGWWGGDSFIKDSICYSCDADFERLKSRTEELRALGIDRFALLLDDLADVLPYPEDKVKFSSLAQAHAFLINRWDDYLQASGASEHLLIVGNKYTTDETNELSGAGWQAYNKELGALMAPGIVPFWTGPKVFSPTIQAADLTTINQLFSQRAPRKVVVWDNWPRAIVALDGRAADLPAVAGGLVTCPVVNEHNKFPVSDFWRILGTSAEYAWRADSYVAVEAWGRWNSLLPQVSP